MTLFTVSVVFLPAGYNHESSFKYSSSLTMEYPPLFCITEWSMIQNLMKFAESRCAHTSHGEMEMSSQPEYLSSYCVNGKNMSCLIRSVIYLEFQWLQNSFHCVIDIVLLFSLLIFLSYWSFRLISLGNNKQLFGWLQLLISFYIYALVPGCQSEIIMIMRMCMFLFSTSVYIKPDFIEIWTFRVVEQLSQANMFREMHSLKEKLQMVLLFTVYKDHV